MKRGWTALVVLLLLIVVGLVSYRFFFGENQPEPTFEGKGGEFRGGGASGSW